MKKLGWLLIIVLLVLYSLVVYSWIEEGNRNFERQEMEQRYEP